MCVDHQYLACLKTSRSQTDKLSFDVGLQEDSTGKTKALQQVSFHPPLLNFYFHLCCSLAVFVFISVWWLHCNFLSGVSMPTSLSFPPYLLMTQLCSYFFTFQLLFPVDCCRLKVGLCCQQWLHLGCIFEGLVISWYLQTFFPLLLLLFILCCAVF